MFVKASGDNTVPTLAPEIVEAIAAGTRPPELAAEALAEQVRRLHPF
jgi:hypothetical protein